MDESSLLNSSLYIDEWCYNTAVDNEGHLTILELFDDSDDFYFEGDLIKTLSQFHHLKTLWIDLSNFNITDISSLNELKGLEKLILTNCCETNDISVLSQLSQLKYLHINNAQINDIAPLTKLSQLEVLELPGNKITDIGPLKELTNLIRIDLADNQLYDASVLSGLNRLTNICLSGNQIIDLSFIKGLNKLDSLEIDRNMVSTLAFLSHLPALTTLSVNDNPIEGITPLAGISDLKHLAILNIRIADLAPLKHLRGLTFLSAGPVDNFDGGIISELTELITLKLNHCDISDLYFLQPLKRLCYLDLKNNSISDCAPLTKLAELITLNLQNNQVSIPLNCMPLLKLKQLNMEGNPFGNKIYDYLYTSFHTEQLNKDIAVYWFEQGDDDKALGYYFIEKKTKISLAIYYRKLLAVKPNERYFKFYYIMRCEEILRTLTEPDNKVSAIRAHLIEIVNSSDFPDKAKIAAKLEGSDQFVYYPYIMAYSAYVNSGKATRPHPEMLYFVCEHSLKGGHDLEKLFSIYKELLVLNSQLYIGVYYVIREALDYRFARKTPDPTSYDHYTDLLLHAGEREIPLTDLGPWLYQNFGRHGQKKKPEEAISLVTPPGRSVTTDTPTKMSAWYIVSRILLACIALMSILRGCK